MRLAIAGAGYQGAVEAYVTGNHLAADCCTTLADRLGGCAGMAGDDSTATEFATSYDEAATVAVEAAGELTFALSSLGHLAAASLHNHAWAETVTGPETPADRAVGVRPAAPPSSLGAGPSTLPGWAHPVLAVLEGVFWPTADTGRLRAAAATWRSAAVSVGLLAAHCSSAVAALEEEVSPEVPLAVAATEDLRGRIEALADHLSALGSACEAYAEQVDAKREEMLDLLEQLAWELGIGAVVTGAIDFFTAGAATPAAGAAGAARLAAASARVRSILESLGTFSRGTASALRPVAAGVRDTRTYLSRLAAARRMEMTERGSFQLLRGRRPDGWLRIHEKPPGHTHLEHILRSDEQLLERLARKRHLPNASTFANQADAERAIDRLLTMRKAEVRRWLDEGGHGPLRLDGHLRDITGRTAWRDGRIADVHGLRIVLLGDSSMPEGFHILTAFPQP